MHKATRTDYPLTVSSWSTGLTHAARLFGIPEHRQLLVSACGRLRGRPDRFPKARAVYCKSCLRKLGEVADG